ncbi:MAG: MarR family transcriptional regulator [Actinobacteria bacterium]|nr:MarR family transcriptional regulator [Actinomycetota bacterium]
MSGKARRITRPEREIEIADRLHSAAIHLLRRVAREDVRSGLSAARLSALSVLVFAGPRSVGDLALVEQVQPPTMTRLVQGLERDGLVRREPSTKDHRVVRILATPKGRRILQAARKRRVLQLAEGLATLNGGELELLERATNLIEGVAREVPNSTE